MKEFLIKISKFLLFTLIIMVLLEVFLQTRYLKGVDDAKSDLHLLVNRNSDIVVFGNSRVRWHIDPRIIEKETGLTTTNVVIDGASFTELNFKLKFYLKYNKAPKYIFISTDLGEQEDSAFKRKYNYLRYIYFTSPYAKDMWTFDKTIDFGEKYIPLYRYSGYYESLLQSFKPISEKSFVVGYQDKYVDRMTSLVHTVDTVDMAVLNKDMDALTANFDKKTKIIFFTPFKPSKVFFTINTEKLKHPYFNTSHLMSRDSLNYFQDGGHLNFNGSQVYSLKIAKLFKEYIN